MDGDEHSTEEKRQFLPSSVKVEVQSLRSDNHELKSLHCVYEPTTVQTDDVPVLPQIFATAASMSFHVVVGVSLAYSSILIPQITAEGSDVPISDVQASWLASSLVLLVPVGALIGGFIMETIGRLNAIKLAAIPCSIGWALIAIGQNFIMILLGRMLTGIAAGMGTSSAIVYTTEIGKPEIRGALTSAGPTLVSLGMLIIYGEGALMDWRTCAWLNMIYIFVPIIVIIIWIPESPVWLIARGRVDEADSAIKWFAGKSKSLQRQELASTVHSQDKKASTSPGLWQRLRSFLKPSGYKPLIILFILFIVQQFSGIYITLFYAINFFQDIGTEIDPNIATVFLGLVRFVMSVINTVLLKYFGRRPLCFVSCLGMAASMTASGVSTMYIKNGSEGISWLPVVCVLAYVCTSMLGLLSIPWTMTAELFSTDIRGIAHGLVISFGYIMMFASVQNYFAMLDFFGGAHVLQWFFAVVSLVGCLHVWAFLPETHGVKLIDIENYFNDYVFYFWYQRRKAKNLRCNGA